MKEHAALVLKNNGKVLFVKRSMKKKSLPGAWAFPSEFSVKLDNKSSDSDIGHGLIGLRKNPEFWRSL